MQCLSNSGDTGISGQVSQNSNLIIDTIIETYPACTDLAVRKNTLVRSAMMLFFEDLSIFKKDPSILQRCTDKKSTDKLLAEICRMILPRTKISLKSKKDNKDTTVSTQVTRQSLKTIDTIIASSEIRDIFESLEEHGPICNNNHQSASNKKSIIIRAALCYFLSRLDDLQKNPSWYQRAITLQSSENVLKKIHLERFGGSQN